MATSSFPNYSNYLSNSYLGTNTGPPARQPRTVRDSPDFQALRRARRTFGAVATILGTGSFLLYVVLSGFTPGLMDQQVFGHVTIGLLIGPLHFVIMGVIAWRYAVRMRDRVDPLVDRLREEEERIREEEEARRAEEAWWLPDQGGQPGQSQQRSARDATRYSAWQ